MAAVDACGGRPSGAARQFPNLSESEIEELIQSAHESVQPTGKLRAAEDEDDAAVAARLILDEARTIVRCEASFLSPANEN